MAVALMMIVDLVQEMRCLFPSLLALGGLPQNVARLHVGGRGFGTPQSRPFEILQDKLELFRTIFVIR